MGIPKKKKQHAISFGKRLQRNKEKIARALPSYVDADRFIDAAQTALIQSNQKLHEADPDSLYMAFKRCAQSGLMPDDRQSTINVYKGTAVWIPMVQGVINQILRSPNVTNVEARVVRKGDAHFDYGYGLDPYLEHKPGGDEAEGGFDKNLTHAYAIARLPEGRDQFEVVTRDEIEKARAQSEAPEGFAWKNWYPEMAKKTAVHRLAKFLDLEPEHMRAIQADIAENWGGKPPAEVGVSPEQRIEDATDDAIREMHRQIERASGNGEPKLTRELPDPAKDDEDQPSTDAVLESEDSSDESDADETEEPSDSEPEVDATDAARQLADEHGIDLRDLWPGSGKSDRIVKSDVTHRIENGPTLKEWTPTEDMSLGEMRAEMRQIIRKMSARLDEPGPWVWPQMLVRMAHTLYWKDDVPRREKDDMVDPTELGEERSADLLEFLRDSATEKVETGEDPMLVDAE